MQEELWIEGIQFDLGDRTVSQTFQVNDLGEIKDRQGNYSNTIRAPRTPKNIAALNYLGIAGSQSRAPFIKLRAKHIVNGIELVSAGYARITETDSTIDIIVYSGNISLMEAIKGKKINELNFTDLNHYLNIISFQDGMARTDGYVYALGDFGYEGADSLINIERQSPSLFFHTLWKKIFDEAGITYSGDFFENNESFKSEVLPPTKGYDIPNEVISSVYLGAYDTDDYLLSETNNKQTFYTHIFELTPNGSLTDMTLIDSKHVRMDFAGVATVYLDTTYFINHGRAGVSVARNGSSVYYLPLPKNTTTVDAEINIVVKQGDIISLHLSAENERIDPYFLTYKAEMNIEAYFEVNRNSGGVFIDFNEISSKMTQADFVKDIMQRYGLMFQSKGTHYQFIQMETLCNDRGSAEDWSDKLSSLGTESYDLGNYGNNNLFKYVYPDDVLEFPQDGTMIADNEHLSDERDMLKSIFTISQQTGILINAPVYQVPIWEGKYDDDGNLKEVKKKETPPRIFKVKKFSGNVQAKFFASAPITITDNIAFLSLENVQMDFYIANYFKAFNRMLNAPRKRTDLFYLSPIDIYKLDFLRLKYLKQLGQFFYLNKVSNYMPGKLTKCELVQINGISAGVVDGNQPPTQLGVSTQNLVKGTAWTLSLSDFINTTPPYFDPEYDAPEQIKIMSFGISHTRMLHNGVEVTGEIIVDANNFDLKIKDYGTTNQAHTATFNFKIQSFNNPNFSEPTGSIVVNVPEVVNLPPVADAGADIIYQTDPQQSGGDYEYETYLDGTNSYDPDGDVLVFFWELIDAPAGVTIDDDAASSPILAIHINNGPNLIQFQIKLTVTDPQGLKDSDTINVTLTKFTGG